jgi:hypothetical protein
MHWRETVWQVAIVVSLFSGMTAAQSQRVKKTLLINGQSGEVGIYQIDGKSYVDIELLAHIANGSVTFQGSQIVVTLPTATDNVRTEPPETTQHYDSAMTTDFMEAGVQFVSAIREWTNLLTYAAKRGSPGDGSRVVVLQDRAAEALRLSKVRASSNSDENALQLLTNHFNNVRTWSDKLVGERRSMDSGKYSLSPDLLERDELYQKMLACTTFLGNMLPSGQFSDENSCR